MAVFKDLSSLIQTIYMPWRWGHATDQKSCDNVRRKMSILEFKKIPDYEMQRNSDKLDSPALSKV